MSKLEILSLVRILILKFINLSPAKAPKTCCLILMKICVCPFYKLDSLKILIGLNQCNCTDRTSNKSGLSLNPDIVPTRIDDES